MSSSNLNVPRFAVVGMGAVGAAACIHLLRALRQRPHRSPIEVHTFEKSGTMGSGLAYATEHDFHVLNMRAKTMSLFCERPTDFSDWLGSKGVNSARVGEEYVPRRLFGDYVRQRLAEQVDEAVASGIHVVHHRAEVTDCHDLGDRTILAVDGARMRFDHVLLCMGHLPVATDRRAFEGKPRYLASPWAFEGYRALPRDAEIGILGTSLTAVDVLLTLAHGGFGGRLHCFARRRGLPKVQGVLRPHQLRALTEQRLRQATDGFTRKLTLREAWRLIEDELALPSDKPGLRERLAAARTSVNTADAATVLQRDLDDARGDGNAWYSALDAAGPFMPMLWQHLRDDAKAEFLGRHESTWAMFRHCMPAPNARKLLELARAGRLEVHPGLTEATYDPDRGQFRLEVRRGETVSHRFVDALIDATGTEFSLDRVDAPLVSNMRARGQLVANPFGGVDVEFDSSRLRYAGGEASRTIHFVGPLTKGVHFYTNSFEMNRDTALRAIASMVSSHARREDHHDRPATADIA